MSKSDDNEADKLAIVILSYLESNEQFANMSPNEKSKVFEVYQEILDCIYKCIKYENVYPILLVHDYEISVAVKNLIEETQELIPALSRITVRTVS